MFYKIVNSKNIKLNIFFFFQNQYNRISLTIFFNQVIKHVTK